MEPILVTPREAERLSGCSLRTLYRELADGKIKAVKRGSATLIIMESLRVLHRHWSNPAGANGG